MRGAHCAAALGLTVAGLHQATAACRTEIHLAYSRYYDPAEISVPTWVHDQPLWAECLSIAASTPPATSSTGIHRDFHHGNSVWEGEALRGIVDWDRLSWGPPDVDVAHAVLNLVVAGHPDLGKSLVNAYVRAGGPPLRALDYWTIADAVDALPDMGADGAAVHVLEGHMRKALRALAR